MSPTTRIVSLHRYPIKSCRGTTLEAGRVERRGFELDRRFMVVDDDGHFRTQRKDPRLATVDVTVDDDARTLRVSADGHGAASIDLAGVLDGPRRDVNVWRHRGAYPDQGNEVAAFFSTLLGAPTRMVHMPDDATRRPRRDLAAGPADRVSFADGYPFLLTSVDSLTALQAHMDEPVPMDRFRANVVVDGAPAWAEDDWSELQLGDVPVKVAKACTRCVITTTDQRTGERYREPMRTLATERLTSAGVTFGVYLIPREVDGALRVGDELRTPLPA